MLFNKTCKPEVFTVAKIDKMMKLKIRKTLKVLE